ELLEQDRHLTFVLNEIHELTGTGLLRDEQIPINEFADLQQKIVKLIVPVELNLAKDASGQINVLNLAKQAAKMDQSLRAFCCQACGADQSLHRGFQYSVVQHVVAHFIEITGQPASYSRVPVDRLLEADTASQPTRPFMLRDVAAIKPPLQKVIGA